MAALLSACDGSGISQARFARQHGVTPGAFAWWRHALSQQRPRGSRRPARFVEVALPPRAMAGATISRSPLLIRMPSGVVVHVASDVDATALETVLSVLTRTC